MADQFDTEGLVENYDSQIREHRDYMSGETSQEVVDTHYTLSELERQSALWSKLCKKLDEMLNSMRESNDNRMNYLDTIELRGKIGMVKEILGWGEGSIPEQELPEAPDSDFIY